MIQTNLFLQEEIISPPEDMAVLKSGKKTKLKVLSLFSGCGGLDLGFLGDFEFRDRHFEKTCFDLVFSNDFDSDATTVYNANKSFFRGHQCTLKDVRQLEENEIPEFDILIAGFPCQPFSNAGKRQGIHDDNGRGTLFYECERILKLHIKNPKLKKPLAFVFENVRGFLSSKMPNGCTVPEEIVKRMKKLGYNTTYKLIRTSDYGVPQNRYRVIMVGVLNGFPSFDFNLLDNVSLSANLPSNNHNPYDLFLGSVLCDIPKKAPHKNEFWEYSPSGQRMIEAIGVCQDGEVSLKHFKNKTPVLKISKTISEGRSWKNMDPNLMTPRFRKIWDNPKKYRSPNFYRRFALGEINGTITASAQPENCGITHPFYNRRFTLREIARIQSFPDDFIFPYKSIVSAYKVIGNAVPPIFGWVIAKSLERYFRNIGICS